MTVIPDNLLRIEDEQTRNQALILWMAGLSDLDRQELSDDLQKFVMSFQPFIDALTDYSKQVITVFSNWAEGNPDLMAYLETLEAEAKRDL